MAINYTALFTRMGRYVSAANYLLDKEEYVAVTLPDDILGEFDARRDLVTNVLNQFTSFGSSVASWINFVKQSNSRVLVDLQSDLNAPSADVNSIVNLLVSRMNLDSETVLKNSVSAGSATAGSDNVGTGLLKSSTLNAAGIPDERIYDSENVLFTCASDTSSGVSAGSERFSLVGDPRFDASSYKQRGNGNGGSIAVANGQNQLTNGNWSTYSGSGIFAGWTTAAGATRISQETSTVLYSGGDSLKLSGDGSATTVTLTQAISRRPLPRSFLALGTWMRKSGTVTAGSNLKIWLTGTGISDVIVFNADPTTLTTSYALSSVFAQFNNIVPADLTMHISWTAANTAGATAVLLISDVVVTTPIAFGNVQYAIFRGPVNFQVGDQFTVATVNDYTGQFQTYFGRFYGIQLPSDASPSIADNLAD